MFSKLQIIAISGIIRLQFSVHGGQLYKRILLESILNLIIWPPSAIVLYLVGPSHSCSFVRAILSKL